MAFDSGRLDYEKERELSWPIYEANVQAYRSTFIASQSFLIAVGAILIDKFWLLIFITIVALVQIWYVWFRVVYFRTMIVDYYKLRLYKEKYNGKSFAEKEYVQNRALRQEINAKRRIRTLRATRYKLDVVLPVSITVIWVAICLAAAIETFHIHRVCINL